MDNRKQRSSSKHCFVLEEGELSDIEDEDNAEKQIEQQRKDDFIREWTERQNASASSVQEAEMEVESDDEEKEGKIDTKPVAMTITFHDESFARSNGGVITQMITQMVMKFGPVMVDSNDTCIFVLHDTKTEEIVKSVAAPLGVMTVVFHDEGFCSQYSKFMLNLCESMFGVSKTTCHDPWLIEVVQNDFLNFEVDTTPYGRDGRPIYNKNEAGMLAVQEKKKGGGRKGGNCFNCLGAHSLRDCPSPRNVRAINENRNKFMEKKSKKPGRYHAEADGFSQFVPGQISENLQQALGLGPKQIPRHVYLMRRYGYPPGWLLEAKVAPSGVTVYGKDGMEFEEGDEDGEIVDNRKDQYDIKKLVAFPGFNTPLPEGVIDEHEVYHCPPLSEEQSFEKLKEELAPNAMQSYKRRKSRKMAEGSSESGDSTADLLSPAEPHQDSFASSSEGPSAFQSAFLATPKAAAKPVVVDLGTPILASHSPFAKLPDRFKFATDVSDVINFENLPDSTGTYEKMVGSIAKIREYNAQNND